MSTIVLEPFGQVNPPTTSNMNTTTVSKTLDSNGRFSISLANADTYSLISVVYQQDPSGQSGFYRIDPTNTTALKGQADILTAANGLTVAVTYGK